MKFFLDQNVDTAVARTLRGHNYEVWTAAEAGLSYAVDDELTVYACNKGAVLVTHDREFSERRARNVIGQHIWLRCSEFDAAELLSKHIDEIVELLRGGRDVWVRVSKEGLDLSRRWD